VLRRLFCSVIAACLGCVARGGQPVRHPSQLFFGTADHADTGDVSLCVHRRMGEHGRRYCALIPVFFSAAECSSPSSQPVSTLPHTLADLCRCLAHRRDLSCLAVLYMDRRAPHAGHPFVTWAFLLVIGFQGYWAVRTVRYDWSQAYSGSREAAHFLTAHPEITAQGVYLTGYRPKPLSPGSLSVT